MLHCTPLLSIEMYTDALYKVGGRQKKSQDNNADKKLKNE